MVLLANTPTQAESLQNSLKQAAGGIGLHVNSNKIEYICFNRARAMSIVNGGSLELDKFTYLSSSISSTERQKHGLLSIGYQLFGSSIHPVK